MAGAPAWGWLGSMAASWRQPSPSRHVPIVHQLKRFAAAFEFLLRCALRYPRRLATNPGCNPHARHPRARRLRPEGGGSRRASALAGDPRLPGRRGHLAAEVLLPVHAAVPLGRAAHGPRAQLHDRRRDQPSPPHVRLQRAAADGLGCVRPAGRKRRDQEQHRAGEVDLRQHRPHARATAGAGLRDRLDPRVRPPASPSTTGGNS